MASFFDRLASLPWLMAQKREITALTAEVERLRAENDRIRVAMRRCVTCHYRLKVVNGTD